METLYFHGWRSPIGPLTLVASERGLVALQFSPQLPKNNRVTWVEAEAKLRPYRDQLEEYFAGKRREFTFALDLRGTDFQQQCWRELLKIPYGETRSYAHIARAVGRPRAFRAVGMANNRNPIAIVVPCHRVIASNGGLCGYGGGLALKEKLLALERGSSDLHSPPSQAFDPARTG